MPHAFTATSTCPNAGHRLGDVVADDDPAVVQCRGAHQAPVQVGRGSRAARRSPRPAAPAAPSGRRRRRAPCRGGRRATRAPVPGGLISSTGSTRAADEERRHLDLRAGERARVSSQLRSRFRYQLIGPVKPVRRELGDVVVELGLGQPVGQAVGLGDAVDEAAPVGARGPPDRVGAPSVIVAPASRRRIVVAGSAPRSASATPGLLEVEDVEQRVAEHLAQHLRRRHRRPGHERHAHPHHAGDALGVRAARAATRRSRPSRGRRTTARSSPTSSSSASRSPVSARMS